MDRKSHEPFMQRCLQLAQLASGDVAPNPIVGAVLVHEGTIIGEGYQEVEVKKDMQVKERMVRASPVPSKGGAQV